MNALLPCVAEGPGIFQPTHQWQDVQKGQSIPQGLHVRMNLQTGRREAKLMDDSEQGNGKGMHVAEIFACLWWQIWNVIRIAMELLSIGVFILLNSCTTTEGL